MSFGYNDNDDAHKKSNYKEWKKTAHVVTDVQINIKSTGISYDDAMTLIECMDNKTPFVLYATDINKDKIIVIPEYNAIKMDGMLMKYQGTRELENSIKLLLFQYNKVYVEPKKLIAISN